MVDYTIQIWKCCNLRRYFIVAWSTTRYKYGSAVIYAVYFTVAWSTTRNKYGSAGEFSVFFCNCLRMVDYKKWRWQLAIVILW